MTILVLHNNYSSAALGSMEQLLYYALPETSLQRNGKPVFLPDYANPALLEVHLAVRICRLGRHISSRFAHRYYDAATVMPHFIAPQLWQRTQQEGLPWTAAMGFDNAIPIGEFVPLDPKEISAQRFSLHIDGEERISGSSAEWLHHVDDVIAEVSQYFTLRRGDILLMGAPTPPVSIEPDHKIETFLGDVRVLSFNVK